MGSKSPDISRCSISGPHSIAEAELWHGRGRRPVENQLDLDMKSQCVSVQEVPLHLQVVSSGCRLCVLLNGRSNRLMSWVM